MAHIRITRAALAVGAAAAAAALLAPGTALAQPGVGGALIETTCTFAQVDAAMHASAPELAARLDAHPDRKAKIQEFLALPVDQRRARVQQGLAEHPGARERIQERKDSPEGQALREKLGVVANTCHNY
ncbi:hemophore-related protein [Nocardia bovistercoris]|uniref:Hemophore-related protein n=1 Tax=Nocardia bovistercoris TaxID=2785916 RepID=A0A931I901_9NOCA|nr:hemophore-related protein [Nocardia bovistercoris]MBH0776904.1 hemophore-related protein [Nocardia bovistercoris]